METQQHIIEQFQEYGKASGAKINLTKTKIMNIGSTEERTTPPYYNCKRKKN